MHPFQTVNEPGFHQLLQSLEPRYEPPDRKSLANNYMQKLYETEREIILDKIPCIEYTLSPQVFGHLQGCAQILKSGGYIKML